MYVLLCKITVLHCIAVFSNPVLNEEGWGLLGISFNLVITTRYIQVLLGQLDSLHSLGDFWQFNIETMKATVYSWILKVWGQHLTTQNFCDISLVKTNKNYQQKTNNKKTDFYLFRPFLNIWIFRVFLWSSWICFY